MNILNLPDDELAKLDIEALAREAEAQAAAATPAEGEASAPAADSTAEETPSEAATQGEPGDEDSDTSADQDSEEEPGDEGAQGSDEAGEGQAQATQEPAAKGTDAKPADEPTVNDKPQEQEAPAVDYEAEYKKLLAPFVANGKEIAVKNVDDAIALMQMGANYNKKMAALKPNLKLLKLLESNGLMSEEKISFLIDLEKKNPEAISKLIKESGMDPMDLDAEKADGYKPTIRTVDDREMELDSVLDEIQDTPSYQRTVTVVSKEWDAESKQVIANQPQLLKVINDHVQRGIYDLISKEMESERMFGRLRGLSDIEAYRQVGDAIQARGGFDHLSAQGQQTPKAPPGVVQPKPKQVDEAKLKEKRRAAAPAKPAAAPSTPAKEFNPLALSDEEFSKLIRPSIL